MNEWIQIYPGVQLPENAEIDAFVILGKPPRSQLPGKLALILGTGCVIRSHSIIYAGNVIGKNFQTGHGVMVRESNTIGDDVSIGTQSVVEHHVVIGNGVRIHTHVFIPEYSLLEDECWIGPRVVITNAKYPRSHGVKDRLQGAHIERGAMIGANATLLPGVRIGARALVGAGAVVTRDVLPGQVVVGNPARVVNSIEKIDVYKGSLNE
jgi:acetyltransferase-like isoleucine patch superfamily enzyme